MIDKAALLAALREGRLAEVARAVFRQEPRGEDTVWRPWWADPRVIATPLLGTSTAEAQVQVARQVVSVLRTDGSQATVPFPQPLVNK